MQDFSENYTCLVPDGVQSLHWAQAQVTVFPVITFRRDEDKNLTEDHLVFLSGDKIHDSAFVELVNNKIHYYYEEQSIVIDHYIEFNDSCASQFKSINAFSLFAKRERHTGRVYFELSHGKGPYDGLGGVIKFLASTAVCAEKLIIRDGKELYDFLINRYTLHNNVSML